MKLIKTKSFELAIFTMGNKDSSRLAVLMPGRLDTKDYANFVSHAEYLASKNFFVVAFDPPGTWESPCDVKLFTTTNYIQATNELIEYFGNRPTLLLGHSRGAATAILVAEYNSVVVGVVSVMANFGTPTAPSSQDIQQGYKDEHRDLPPGTSITNIQKEFKLPLSYWEDGKKYSAGESLKGFTKPKLIIYGIEDEFVSPVTVKKLYETISDPKMIKEIISTHDYRRDPNTFEEVNNTIGQFLDKYINS